MNVVDLDSLTKVTKTYSSGDTTVLYVGRECTPDSVNEVEPRFLRNRHGSRESVTYYKSGMIVSSTDNHCYNAPVRRRAVFLLAWSVVDSCWLIWHVSSVSSIYSGKRMIDDILETGML